MGAITLCWFLLAANQQIASKVRNLEDVEAVGISYQMHGLVCVDKNKEVLRPSIIWCDSRAVQIGEQAAKDIGGKKCLKNLFNLPGNFTTSKLKWVKENESEVYSKINKIMLSGDYIGGACYYLGKFLLLPSIVSYLIISAYGIPSFLRLFFVDHHIGVLL